MAELYSILIVEDDPTHAVPLQKVLESEDYNVVGISQTEDEAVEMAERLRPDLILMDISLDDQNPSDDGGIRAVKRLHGLNQTAIIYMTAYDISGDGAQANETRKKIDRSRYDDVLTKPWDEKQWLATMRLCLYKRHGKKIVFISYCHEEQDKVIANEIMLNLNPLDSIGVEPWIDTKISYGDNWKVEIDGVLRRANYGLVLISRYFANSRFIRTMELPKLLAGRETEGLKVIPVFVESIAEATLKVLGLAHFKGVGSNNDPVGDWSGSKRQKSWAKLSDYLAGRSQKFPSL